MVYDPKHMIRFEEVGFRYGNGPEVLRDVDLDLAPGSFHWLTGASGAGKSTLLKLLHLADHPTRGRVEAFGEDLSELKRRHLPKLRRQIGMVFQDFRLLDHLTVFDNVALPLRLARVRDSSLRKDVGEMLDWVGLADVAGADPRTLSGGQQQRVAIARAVVARPLLLLADEPTGSVDEATGTRILRLFQELHRLGTTVLVATHNELLIERFPHPVLRLEDGQLGLVRA
ncbi:cell division ATP-binding protein FtsE [Rhodospirillales bacterium TMPK1]|uniref:Cell division ATP-binding protein FtsE n=2 Tax=Roseiterribacter gracilis TaxID=2812848 RepID=A0A8S8XAC6_9PROT|nr:cell division ATP-binding protein FtsE [Rhodospirillales bacterium TMPK1]